MLREVKSCTLTWTRMSKQRSNESSFPVTSIGNRFHARPLRLSRIGSESADIVLLHISRGEDSPSELPTELLLRNDKIKT